MEGYKQTELGMIPNDWQIKPLITLSINGINNGVFNDPKKVGSGYKLINVVNMYSGSSIDIDSLNELEISTEEFKKNKVLYGDIFFTRSSLVAEGIAHCNINLSNHDKLTFDGHLMRLRPNTDIIYPQYLNFYCKTFKARQFFISRGKTATMTTIGQDDIAGLPVLIPPLSQQQKIAEILSTVDDKLDIIEEKIKETQQLKKSLMQTLLTKGIGHTKFKNSPLGEIPESWEVKNAVDVGIEFIDGDRGSNYPNLNDFKSDGYCLFLTAKNVTKNGFSFNECQFITKEKDNQLRKGKLIRNDIVITTRGSVGNISHYDYSIPFENVRLNSGMAIIRDGKGIYDKVFLYQYLKSRLFQSQLENISFGSAQPQLTIKELLKTKLPILQLQEQKKISSILTSVDEKLEVMLEKKTEYTELKKGLMQQLLTGKIRVNHMISE